MLWIETRTQADADARRSAMWGLKLEATDDGGLVGKAAGEGLYEAEEFWADAIKRVRDDPQQRLAMAKRHLPLPAAFREAAIALRAIIKERRNAGSDFDPQLRELHHLAAIGSLAGYDPLDITPFAKIKRLDLKPETLGWNALTLLGVTDRKLMRETWGEPQQHVSAKELYPEIEKSADAKLKRHRSAELKRSMEKIDQAFAERAPEPSTKKPGLLARLFGWRY